MESARSLERSGDEQGALQAYRMVEARAGSIVAEVVRVNAGTRAQSQQDLMRRMDADALLSQLGIAETKIGIYYEGRADYSDAAAYYQRAIATHSTGSIMAYRRLAFLYAYGRAFRGIATPHDAYS